MKHHVFLSLLLTFACAGCTASGGLPNHDAFPSTDDPDLPFIVRNGENYAKAGIGYSYDEMLRPASVEALCERIDKGESVFLFLYADDCNACAASHDNLAHFFLDSGIEAFGAHFVRNNTSETVTMLRTFAATYPGYSSLFGSSFFTPTAYLLKSPTTAYPLAFQDYRGNVKDLEDYFRPLMNLAPIYRVQSYEGYLSASNFLDGLVYRDSDETNFFYSTIYPRAIHSDKPIIHIENAHLSEADQAKFDGFLKQGDLLLMERSSVKQKINAQTSPSGAQSLLNQYYR